jgi:hypothetical protein
MNKFNQIIEQNKSFEGYRVGHRFPKIGFKKMLLNARLLWGEGKRQEQILLAIEDVTGLSASGEGDQIWQSKDHV